MFQQKSLLVLLFAATLLLAACGKTEPTVAPNAPEVVPPTSAPTTAPAPTDAGSGSQAYPAPDQSVFSRGAYPAPGELSGYEPAAGDESWERGTAMVEFNNSSLVVMESNPVQVALLLRGNLPDPCHQLRVSVSQPDEKNQIQVEVYSVAEPGKACVTVLEPFEARVSLGSFAAGKYSVWVNGQLMGEF